LDTPRGETAHGSGSGQAAGFALELRVNADSADVMLV
jgi:hypothetical protein